VLGCCLIPRLSGCREWLWRPGYGDLRLLVLERWIVRLCIAFLSLWVVISLGVGELLYILGATSKVSWAFSSTVYAFGGGGGGWPVFGNLSMLEKNVPGLCNINLNYPAGRNLPLTGNFNKIYIESTSALLFP
jgi:hypothetical protein